MDYFFNNLYNSIELHRLPKAQTPDLRAWDAADEYLINTLFSDNYSVDRPIIFNDMFGALTISLASFAPICVTDSFLSFTGIQENALRNGIDTRAIQFLRAEEFIPSGHSLVILKIPKNLALLEWQLQQIKRQCPVGTKVVAAGMLKYLPKRAFELIERYIGAVSTSLAKKKARLIFAELEQQDSELLMTYPTRYQLPCGLQLSNHANLFSRESLDIGSRFFLEHLPQINDSDTVADLACGNGVLGIHLARLYPTANYKFFDESYMAVASARMNVEDNIMHPIKVEYVVDNCLSSASSNSFDVVINNPPFHQGQVVGDYLAWQMFLDAKRTLKPNGRLRIVGNRHLGYHIKLKKIFGNVTQVAANKKFVILESIKN